MQGFVRAASISAILLVAAACGGGGGGGGSGANDQPVLGSLAFTTNENVALSAQLSAMGSGTVTFTKTGNPASGAVSSFTTAGAFVYTPNANFVGADTFTVQAMDGMGRTNTGTVMITVHANHAPVAKNAALRADGTALTSIDVLANVTDADGDPLVVTIEEAALAGTANVNSDGTVGITMLPSGFKGLTRFKYRATDPSGASTVGTEAVFVGADPFRALFVGDASGNGAPEVYLTDFANDPAAVSAATQGNLRLRGFAASDNGATVVYRAQDTTAATTMNLSFVKTATPAQQTGITLPNGVTPVLGANGLDQFRVSPDGQWIAVIAGQGATTSLYVLSVSSPTVSPVTPAGAVYATLPRFSQDSKSIYFLASTVSGGANRSLYFASLSSPGMPVLVSAAAVNGSSDDVLEYSVSQDQSRILAEANRGGKVGFYFIDPAHLTTEVQVSETLALGESILESTIGLVPGKGGSATGTRVAYTVQSLVTFSTYVAEVSATPNPRLVATSGSRVVGFRPDDAALLYTRTGQIYEDVIDSGTTDQLVGSGGNAWYDSTGNIVLVEQFLASGGSPPSYPALATTVRGSFGTTQPVGTPVLAAQYINVTGFDRGAALIGEGPTTGAAPTSVHLALVNAVAPSSLLYLAGFQSPLQLTSDVARVVTK